jgi:hypothetical protein
MKTVRFILITAMICSIVSCQAQVEKKVTDKEFQTFLDKFKIINPPINYKTIQHLSVEMSEEEAIKFLHKVETDIYCVLEELGEDDRWYKTIEKNIPGCKFKYELNDSVYVLCIPESILGVNNNTTLVFLYSFTHKGDIIDKNLVCKEYDTDEDWVSFVLLDKTHVRVFYYTENYEREKKGYLSTVYYVNYEITSGGKFIEKNKSDIIWLKNSMIQYSVYKPNSDDPMNEYDF